MRHVLTGTCCNVPVSDPPIVDLSPLSAIASRSASSAILACPDTLADEGGDIVMGDAGADVQRHWLWSSEADRQLSHVQQSLDRKNRRRVGFFLGQPESEVAATSYYDGQGMMVRAADGFTSVDDLATAPICVLQLVE